MKKARSRLPAVSGLPREYVGLSLGNSRANNPRGKPRKIENRFQKFSGPEA
jgi:hypothetical protein